MSQPDQTPDQWLAPWRPLRPGEEALGEELRREIGPRHPFFGREAIAVARRDDNDDVLFALPDSEFLLAVVHLTWSGRTEGSPEWPETTFYTGWPDWIERCMLPSCRNDYGEWKGLEYPLED
jgi:hypothetical protein